MKRLDKAQIDAAFKADKRSFEERMTAAGATQALEEISKVLGDLREAGHEVSLEVFGDASAMAFDMFSGKGTVPISGVLRIGDIHRLFAIATKIDNQPAMQIALSNLDIRFNGAKAKIAEGAAGSVVSTSIYDLKNDPDAILKFEKQIVEHLARNAVVHDYDPAQSFGDSAPLRKLSVKPK